MAFYFSGGPVFFFFNSTMSTLLLILLRWNTPDIRTNKLYFISVSWKFFFFCIVLLRRDCEWGIYTRTLHSRARTKTEAFLGGWGIARTRGTRFMFIFISFCRIAMPSRQRRRRPILSIPIWYTVFLSCHFVVRLHRREFVVLLFRVCTAVRLDSCYEYNFIFIYAVLVCQMHTETAFVSIYETI